MSLTERARSLGPKGGALVVAAFALIVRLAIVAWAYPRIPAAADGVYYDTIARRIATGHGYTWLWPDGAVTYAAHYPVGYPAAVGAAYAIFGAHVAVAMLENALVGTIGAVAAYATLARIASPARALLGGVVVAAHPALALYTPALMTEGATTTLLALALLLATRGADPAAARPWQWRALAGAALGAATLVRPQCIVLAPVLGALAVPAHTLAVAARLTSAVAVTTIALACCAPWTARNCIRMERCALVSVNGGWNLLIGAQTTSGAWAPVEVPPECREVWAEAAKDDCFGRVARSRIAAAPGAFVAAMTRKIAVTFDYFGGAPWYLHEANAEAFPEQAKVAAGVVETVVSRGLVVGALAAVVRRARTFARARWAVAAVGAVFACTLHGWVAYAILAALTLVRRPSELAADEPLVPFTGLLILATMATHAAFFGAGRYGLVVVPFVTMLAFIPPSLRGGPHNGRFAPSTPT